MKTLTIKFLVIAFFVLFTSANTYAQITKADIIATGLTCSMCSNAINKALESMPQVENVTADLNTNTFTVSFKEDAVIQPVELKDAVEKAGFFIGSMTLTMNVDAEKVKDNSTLTTQEGSFIFIDNKPVVGKEAQYKVLDKGFVTKKEFDKLSKSYSKVVSFKSDKGSDYHLIAQK